MNSALHFYLAKPDFLKQNMNFYKFCLIDYWKVQFSVHSAVPINWMNLQLLTFNSIQIKSNQTFNLPH